MIRVVIVDDHPIVRGGLRDTFAGAGDIVVVGEAGDGAEGIAQVELLAPDVVLMDLRMPGTDGVAATAALRTRAPDARVLILTTFDSESDVLPAIEAGATGYLLKDAVPDELMRAVRAAARGESVLAPSVTRHLMGQVPQARRRLADRPGEGGPATGRRRPFQPGGRRGTVHRRGEHQDPPPARLRQVRRPRPGLGGGRGLPPPPAHLTRPCPILRT